jgi:hypothetical protein
MLPHVAKHGSTPKTPSWIRKGGGILILMVRFHRNSDRWGLTVRGTWSFRLATSNSSDEFEPRTPPHPSFTQRSPTELNQCDQLHRSSLKILERKIRRWFRSLERMLGRIDGRRRGSPIVLLG